MRWKEADCRLWSDWSGAEGTVWERAKARYFDAEQRGLRRELAMKK